MKLLLYGSLREGQYNNTRIKNNFGQDAIKTLETKQVSGFKMYHLGHYPAVYPSNTEDKILCELAEVSKPAFEFIDRMELGAGYKRHKVDDSTVLYVYSEPLEDIFPEVKGGDWLKRDQ